MLRSRCLLLTVLMLWACDCARGDDLTQRYARAIEAAIPGAQVTIVDENTLKVVGPGSDLEIESHADNLRIACAQGEQSCADALASSVRGVQDTLASIDAPPADRSAVRAVLHEPQWMANARAQAADQLIAEPFVGDLTTLYVIDRPDTILNLSPTDRERLGLAGDALHTTAIANLRAATTDFTMAPIEGRNPNILHMNIGDSYEAARLLIVDRWAEIAARVQGDLVVSVPSRDHVLATGSASAVDVMALRVLTTEVYQTEHHALSAMLFKWSPSGWTVYQ